MRIPHAVLFRLGGLPPRVAAVLAAFGCTSAPAKVTGRAALASSSTALTQGDVCAVQGSYGTGCTLFAGAAWLLTPSADGFPDAGLAAPTVVMHDDACTLAVTDVFASASSACDGANNDITDYEATAPYTLANGWASGALPFFVFSDGGLGSVLQFYANFQAPGVDEVDGGPGSIFNADFTVEMTFSDDLPGTGNSSTTAGFQVVTGSFSAEGVPPPNDALAPSGLSLANNNDDVFESISGAIGVTVGSTPGTGYVVDATVNDSTLASPSYAAVDAAYRAGTAAAVPTSIAGSALPLLVNATQLPATVYVIVANTLDAVNSYQLFAVTLEPAPASTCSGACDTGSTCSSGACVCWAPYNADCLGSTNLGASTAQGGGACTNLGTDRANCGSCGHACGAGQLCSSGACVESCASPTSSCTSYCANLNNDPDNCGTCGHNCGAGKLCSSGACVESCASPTSSCTSYCANLTDDPQNCGSCGATCTIGKTDCCSSACTDEQTDPNNCGGCGIVCSATSPSTVVCAGGRCLTTLAAGRSAPYGMTISATNVYWADNTGGTVTSVPIGGGAVTTLASGQSYPYWVAVTAADIFWTDFAYGSGTKSPVMKLPIGGGTPATFAANQSYPIGIAANANNVYWSDWYTPPTQTTGTVMSEAVGGGSISTVAGTQELPYGVALDANNVYWATEWGDTIVKAPLGGGAATTLASGRTGDPVCVAVDATNVYWTEQGGDVMKVPIAGGAVTTLATGQGDSVGIAVDATNVYFASEANGNIMAVPIGGGTPVTLASGQATPWGLAADGTSVYWVNAASGSNGAVMKVSPK